MSTERNKKQVSESTQRPSIEEVIAGLKSEDLEERLWAAEVLRHLAMSGSGLAEQEGVAAIEAAADPFPPSEDWRDDPSESLVSATIWKPRPAYVPVVTRLFPNYSRKAQYLTFLLLEKLDSRMAVEAFMQILQSYGRTIDTFGWPLWPIPQTCQHWRGYLPDLMRYLDIPGLESSIYGLAMACFESGSLRAGDFSPEAVADLLRVYQSYADHLMPLQRVSGQDWIWEGDYWLWRLKASQLLVMMGFLPAPTVQQALRNALAYADPVLKGYALLSLIQQDQEVEGEHLHVVASSAEMRNRFYEGLLEWGKESIFPEAYCTQESFAESEMVRWLKEPTELGRVPDEIELMGVATVEPGTEEGLFDYYVFRYRTFPPHEAAEQGWMVSIAGAFLRTDAPTTTATGDTFTLFEPWEDKAPIEHVRRLMKIFHGGDWLY